MLRVWTRCGDLWKKRKLAFFHLINSVRNPSSLASLSLTNPLRKKVRDKCSIISASFSPDSSKINERRCRNMSNNCHDRKTSRDEWQIIWIKLLFIWSVNWLIVNKQNYVEHLTFISYSTNKNRWKSFHHYLWFFSRIFSKKSPIVWRPQTGPWAQIVLKQRIFADTNWRKKNTFLSFGTRKVKLRWRKTSSTTQT